MAATLPPGSVDVHMQYIDRKLNAEELTHQQGTAPLEHPMCLIASEPYLYDLPRSPLCGRNTRLSSIAYGRRQLCNSTPPVSVTTPHAWRLPSGWSRS
jgi:hypothetical protein